MVSLIKLSDANQLISVLKTQAEKLEVVTISNTNGETLSPIAEHLELGAHLLAPIQGEHEISGILMLGRSNAEQFSQFQVALIQNLLLHLDIAINNQREQQELVKTERKRIANSSHDFRIPLTVINANAFLLRKSADSVKQDRYFDVIQQQTTRLAEMIDQLHELVKLTVSRNWK